MRGMSAELGEEVREQAATDVPKVNMSISRQHLLGSRGLRLKALLGTMPAPQRTAVIPYRVELLTGLIT